MLVRLITQTGGNTLLLTWTAWQFGSSYCTTIADALSHLRSCPQGNDPLQFIFGDLLARFTPGGKSTSSPPLKLLTNRSIVIPQEGEEKLLLVWLILIVQGGEPFGRDVLIA